jgi:hypothetical protein
MYGTLPPAVPFSHITLVNKANAEAYISLHVDLDGSNTVIEYPVEGRIKIQAPVGFYTYVTWVGGRKMVGEFKLHGDDDLTITLFKDKVVINRSSDPTSNQSKGSTMNKCTQLTFAYSLVSACGSQATPTANPRYSGFWPPPSPW